MQLLFIFVAVVLIIIIIARLASKTRPENERLPASKSDGLYTVNKIEQKKNDHVIEALMNLLVKKGLVTEEEIVQELESMMKEEKAEKAQPKDAG